MLILLLLFLAGCGASSSSPAAQPQSLSSEPSVLTWHLHGTLADGGTIDGTFSYDDPAVMRQENAHGLSPNRTYNLTDWTVTASSVLNGVPPIPFETLGVGDTAEVCVGVCIFSDTEYQRVVFADGRHTLQLAFLLPQSAPLSLPATIGEWGRLDPSASWLMAQKADGTFDYLITLTEATIN